MTEATGDKDMLAEMASGALAGLVVVALTRVLSGPYCTQILGDQGAEVIKVEPPQGDEVRDWGPPFKDGDASYFIGVNRNKRSIGLDLRQESARAVLRRLLERADVLIENFKPGTLEGWGLGYQETLQPAFPRLIHCRITGFGSDGPLGGRPGYDAAIQAFAGMMSVNGTPESGPTRVGIPLVDLGTGLYAAIAILTALYERARSGQGQFIDMTLFDSAIALLHPHIPNYELSGRVPGLTGNAHPNICPYDKFRTKTVEIFLAVGNDRAFQRLSAELARPDLAEDPRFLHNSDRLANAGALRELLEVELAKHDGQALSDRLLEIGVPAGPLLNIEQLMGHPHTAHRGMHLEVEGYGGWGDPIKFSRSSSNLRHKPPRYGQHSREILAEAGFSEAECDALLEEGVVLEERRR